MSVGLSVKKSIQNDAREGNDADYSLELNKMYSLSRRFVEAVKFRLFEFVEGM